VIPVLESADLRRSVKILWGFLVRWFHICEEGRRRRGEWGGNERGEGDVRGRVSHVQDCTQCAAGKGEMSLEDWATDPPT